MRKSVFSAALVAACCLHAVPAAAIGNNGPDILITDIITGVIPLGALAVTYFSDDELGQKQWYRNTGLNLLLTSVARLGFNETKLGERPNGGEYGFPSGHESFVMSGAAFLGERYGWKWGLPAYAGAIYVGYVRVHRDKHHFRDVLASGALSYGVALLTVTPEQATHLAPVVGPDFLGLRWERSF